MIHIQVMHDASEVILYNTAGLPVKIIHPTLSDYPGKRVVCHWHEDIELIYIVSGQMHYEINGKTVRLPEHSALFVNARQLHYGFAADGAECEFICVLFHPSLLRGSDKAFQDMVMPVIGSEAIEYLLLEESGSGDYRLFSGCMRELAALRDNAAAGYEWEVLGALHRLWSVVFRQCEVLPAGTDQAQHADRQVQRNMVSYIFRHFAEPLTLEEIAASGHVSRSKCCLIFRKYLGESPIEFVNSYRLEKSCLALRDTRQSVTDIALGCGFSHPSYFSKLFFRKYGCTPSAYRKEATVSVKERNVIP